jgi:hypothetical protein
MRFAFHIDSASIAARAAFRAGVALIAVPAGVYGQETISAQSATLTPFADIGVTPQVAVAPDILASQDAAIATATETASNATTEAGQFTGSVLRIPADGASANNISLDDQMLSRQRGGALGMVMAAATQQLTRSNGSNVTLWDEIAPPSPLPVPVDAARAAQVNVAMYLRK